MHYEGESALGFGGRVVSGGTVTTMKDLATASLRLQIVCATLIKHEENPLRRLKLRLVFRALDGQTRALEKGELRHSLFWGRISYNLIRWAI